MSGLLRPGAAAGICGLSTKTLAKLARDGKIPGAAELLPGLWRFDEYELRAWIRRGQARCQERASDTSTRGDASMRFGSRSTAKTLREAYEQALKPKRSNG